MDDDSPGWFLKPHQGDPAEMAEKPDIVYKIGETLSPGRIFFPRGTGHYGINEAGTQVGDVVVLVFPDDFVSFILRKFGDNFEIASIAYMKGPFREVIIK